VRLYVGVTDNAWFRYLRDHGPYEAVNFWRPSARSFRALMPGELFLFLLHAPIRRIAGGGFFLRYDVMPLEWAWQIFGTANGADSLTGFRSQLQRYRADVARDFLIGAIVLAEPFFLPEAAWIPPPETLPPNAQSGKVYDLDEPDGRQLWQAVADLLKTSAALGIAQEALVESARHGRPRLVVPRLGQQTFRLLVADAYDRRCAVTDDKILPALEACHIQPFAEGGPHEVRNGLLLRADLHRLFDAGYLTVDPKTYQVVVSRRLRDEFQNGRQYYALHGQAIRRPVSRDAEPDPEFLRYHAEHIFKGA
jgi:putative restriction endonuclease